VSDTLAVTGGTGKTIETDIPARLDRLPWSRWHWLVIIALGITWILDGLEVTLVGSVAAVLTQEDTLHLTTSQATAAGSFYLAGAVLALGILFIRHLVPESPRWLLTHGRAEEAEEVVGRFGKPLPRKDGAVLVELEGGAVKVAPVVRALDEAGLGVEALDLVEPTLDDVFLEKTGHHLEPEEPETGEDE